VQNNYSIDSLFDEGIDSTIGGAKLADIWLIETVWGRGKRLRRD
jgi:hypothetical protein